jgi:hypothetical protein
LQRFFACAATRGERPAQYTDNFGRTIMTIRFYTAKAALIALLGPVTVVSAQESPVSLSALSAREQRLASLGRMPEAQLKAMFVRRDRESRHRMLDVDEGVQCAMAWDALFRRGFAGKVDALLAWWRISRDDYAAR